MEKARCLWERLFQRTGCSISSHIGRTCPFIPAAQNTDWECGIPFRSRFWWSMCCLQRASRFISMQLARKMPRENGRFFRSSYCLALSIQPRCLARRRQTCKPLPGAPLPSGLLCRGLPGLTGTGNLPNKTNKAWIDREPRLVDVRIAGVHWHRWSGGPSHFRCHMIEHTSCAAFQNETIRVHATQEDAVLGRVKRKEIRAAQQIRPLSVLHFQDFAIGAEKSGRILIVRKTNSEYEQRALIFLILEERIAVAHPGRGQGGGAVS